MVCSDVVCDFGVWCGMWSVMCVWCVEWCSASGDSARVCGVCGVVRCDVMCCVLWCIVWE